MKTTGAVYLMSSIFIIAILTSGCGNQGSNFGTPDFSVKGITITENSIPRFPTEEIYGELPTESDSVNANGILRWAPTATRQRETRKECRMSYFRRMVNIKPGDVHNFLNSVQALFDNCESELLEGSHLGLVNQLKVNLVDYNVEENPYVKEIKIEFSNGEKLRGYIAIKPGKKKRPMVIGRCGVYCNVGNDSTRTMLMHLFDEAPFNAIILGNITGRDFVNDNKTFAMGGYYEAIQQVKLAQYLTSPESPYKDSISSVHVFGLSLGGNAAVMSSVLSHYNRGSDGELPIKSVFALCPVADLHATLDEVLQENLRGKLMARGAWNIMRDLYRLRGQPVPDKKPSVREIYRILTSEAQAKFQSTFSHSLMSLAPFKSLSFAVPEDIWTANRFPMMASTIQTPTFVFTSEDDGVVPTNLNSKRVLQRTSNRSDTQVITKIVPQGGHCAEGVAYGWDTMSELTRSFILDFSPEFRANEHTESVEISPYDLPAAAKKLKEKEYHFSQAWSARSGSRTLNLTFNIWSPGEKSECVEAEPTTALPTCFKQVSMEVPLNYFSSLGYIRVPETTAQAQAVTRWANRNLEIRAADGSDLAYSRSYPKAITWRDY